jgi:hypothetical protein
MGADVGGIFSDSCTHFDFEAVKNFVSAFKLTK